eukprot:Anaeramoba_ignava/a504714_61.p1 GENE.a504714_61~~a504714_61.p1  ORF type:complete len:114 (-),score=10.75 a504714_61:195-536(-)
MTSSVTVAQATTIIYGIIIGIYGLIKFLRDNKFGKKFLIGGILWFIYFLVSFIVSLVHKTTKAGLVMSVIGISVFIIVLTILLIKFRGGVFYIIYGVITLVCWIIVIVGVAKA